jgi:hypothetical protein
MNSTFEALRRIAGFGSEEELFARWRKNAGL